MADKAKGGMRAFTIIWSGQFVSLLGTGMTRFALTLWAWELTGSATALALVGFFGFAPSIVISPIAGALVDRWDRKLVMMISDFAAGLATIAILLISAAGHLDIWHLYVAAAFASTFESFQFPAYSAAITNMVDKKQYARTSAMMGLAGSASGIISPIAAAALYGILQLNGILLIDIVTFVFALVTLFFVYIPPAKRSEAGVASRGSLWSEAGYGFRFIWQRKSMFGLQVSFFFANLLFGMTITLMNPMILARTGNNEAILATVSAAFGIGGLVGGIFMTWWGGFKEQRVRGVFWSFSATGFFGIALAGMGQHVLVWFIGALVVTFFLPIANASNQAIWQIKVPPDVQGKVFAARRMIAAISTPAAMIIGGTLADYVFEPAMQADGALAGIFGGIVGTGDGAGMGLMFVFIGIAVAIVGMTSYSIPLLRNVETLVPDFDAEMA